MHNQKTFDLENEGQGHEVQHLQREGGDPTANINPGKTNHTTHFFATALILSEILMFRICDLENLGQDHVRSGPIRWQISTFHKSHT